MNSPVPTEVVGLARDLLNKIGTPGLVAVPAMVLWLPSWLPGMSYVVPLRQTHGTWLVLAFMLGLVLTARYFVMDAAPAVVRRLTTRNETAQEAIAETKRRSDFDRLVEKLGPDSRTMLLKLAVNQGAVAFNRMGFARGERQALNELHALGIVDIEESFWAIRPRYEGDLERFRETCHAEMIQERLSKS